MIINLLTAYVVTVGVCSFFNKMLSKIFPADGLNCWPIVYFYFNILRN